MKRLPNLASRPFINTRPVVLVIVTAVLVGVVMLLLNLRLFFSTSGTTEALGQRVVDLEAQKTALESDIRDDLEALQAVEWRRLETDVQAANLVLKAHAFSWGRLLTHLEATLPYAVRLVRVSPKVEDDRTVQLSLQGIGQSREAMLEFMANLLESDAFERVEPSGETLPEGAASAGYEFDLDTVYVPEQLRSGEVDGAATASAPSEGAGDEAPSPRRVPMADAAAGAADALTERAETP